MTQTEIRDLVRQQLKEETQAFFLDTDIDNYIFLGVKRFFSKTKSGIVRVNFTITGTELAEEAVAEVIDITCVKDINAILDKQSFLLVDGDGTQFTLKYIVDDLAAITTVTNEILINIEKDDSADKVASATSSVIDSINSGNSFDAFEAANIVNVTNKVANFLKVKSANNDVDNGAVPTEDFLITVVTSGLSESLDIGFNIIKERAMVFEDFGTKSSTQNQRFPMVRVSFEDFRGMLEKTDDDTFKHNRVSYFIDVRKNRIFFNPDIETAKVFAEFYINADKASLNTIFSTNILPEEYHEAIINYAIHMAFKVDENLQMANHYLEHYLADERAAVIEIQQRQPSNINDGFSMAITNPHRNEDELLQDNIVI